MRRNKEERIQKKRGRRLRRAAVFLLISLSLVLSVAMFVEAGIVHVEYADVQLRDLPPAFDGATILFLSDIHLDFYNPPDRAAALVHTLVRLKPDLILLGGDYTSFGLTLMLQSTPWGNKREALKAYEGVLRDSFFRQLSGIYAPLGKYGVSGNHDTSVNGLEASMALGGFELLQNRVQRIEKDGETLYLAGLDDWGTGNPTPDRLSQHIRGSDCAVLLCHNPDALPQISNTAGADGAQWVDLMLSGHTHGGQIRIFGYSPVSATRYGERYRSGWLRESATELLTSNGVGTFLLPFRLGAPAQAHLITLRTPDE